MTSLTRFKQKLRGETPEKTEPKLEEWLELVTEVEETVVEEIDLEIEPESMTKTELDEYALEAHGIQLDRRQTKINMITEFIQKLKEKN
jgi:hypothetical protein